MIKQLTWDSDFFGYSIGLLNSDDPACLSDLKTAEGFRLVYVFSELEIPELASHVDKKTQLSMQLDNSRKNSGNCRMFDADSDSYQQLKELSLNSGVYSRYKTDPNFSNGEYEKLYSVWLDKSLSGEMADRVIVREYDGNIAGFITLKLESEGVASIGLLAVGPAYRGKNIGSDLIDFCAICAMEAGCHTLNVTTQGENLAAMRLYSKAGFKIKTVKYVYHIWYP